MEDRFPAKAKCYFCHNELQTREIGVHRYTKGWVKNRSGGGGHGISLRERENKWAHKRCVDERTVGRG